MNFHQKHLAPPQEVDRRPTTTTLDENAAPDDCIITPAPFKFAEGDILIGRLHQRSRETGLWKIGRAGEARPFRSVLRFVLVLIVPATTRMMRVSVCSVITSFLVMLDLLCFSRLIATCKREIALLKP